MGVHAGRAREEEVRPGREKVRQHQATCVACLPPCCARKQVAREIWLHAQLCHPAVIALFAAWKDRDLIYLCMEWADEVRAYLT